MPSSIKRSASKEELRRRRAHRLGIRAEWLAIIVLIGKGYRILARRYGVPGGEIDIVATRGETIAFVEVKARPLMEEAMAAITPAKRRRLSRAAAWWLTRNGWAAQRTLRGDAIFVAPGCWPRHLADAFELDLR